MGTWLITQRRVREGQIPGQLTQQQIQRLDSIGMVWGNRNEIAWQRGLESAQKYHDAHGNLMVPGKYTDPEGYPLGQWIIKTRQQRLNDRLKEERIAQLDEIGMVWSVFDVKWEKAFALAVAYYEQNGNLNMPRSYVTAAGEKLGCWVANQQWAYQKESFRMTRSCGWKGSGCIGATAMTASGTKDIRKQSAILKPTGT